MKELFSRLRVPDPSEELRRSTLAAATARWSHPTERDRWRQVWESRPLRVAWASTVVLLIGFHLFVSRKVVPSQGGTPPMSEELQEIAKLPRLRAEYAMGAPEPVRAINKEKRT